MKILLYTCLFGLVFWTGCRKVLQVEGVDTEDWDPDLALAIINTKASIDDILSNFETGGFVGIDPSTGGMRLVYEGTVFSTTGEELINIPDFTIPVPDSFITEQFNFPSGDVIQRADFKTGTLAYTLQSPISGAVEVELQFPSATQNGQPLTTTVTLNSTTAETGSISLDNTSFDFANNNNEFPIRYVATEVASGNRILLSNAEVEFQSLEYSFVQGYIGNYNFNLPLDTVILDLFQNWKQGELYFEDPLVEVTIRNSFGIPVELTLDKLEANTFNGGVIPFNSSQLNSGISLSYPSLAELGETKETVITIDKTTNLPSIISNVPKELYYQASAEANPSGTQTTNTFFLDTSKFSVDVRMELPLYGWARNFVVEDVYNLDLSIYEEFDFVNFKLITENGFPAEAKMQLYFEDGFGNVYDSLIHKTDPLVIAAAPVDGSGKVTEINIEENLSQFPKDRYQNLLDNATKIRLVARFQTTDADQNNLVRIYPEYDLAVKLGARGSLNMEEI